MNFLVFASALLLVLPAAFATPCLTQTWTNAGPCNSGKQLQYRTPYLTGNVTGCSLEKRTIPCSGGRKLLVTNKNCIYSDFSKYGSCVGNVKTKYRTVLQEAIGTGKPCDYSVASLTRTQACQNCVMTDWVNQGACVNNLQNQTRTKVSDPVNGGDKCGARFRQVPCGAAVLQGSYHVLDGPNWWEGPPSYSCIEACSMLFGGNPIDYSCSTVNDNINNLAHYDGWGMHDCSTQIYAQDFKQPTDGSSYDCGTVGCSWSAYVHDGCFDGLDENFCWKSV